MLNWNIWRDRAERPFVHPDYLFIVDALQMVGARIFGDAWTGRELAVTEMEIWQGLPSPTVAFVDGELRDDMKENHAASVWHFLERQPDWMDRKFGPTREQWDLAFSRYYDVFANFDEIIRRKALLLSYIHKAAALGWLGFDFRDAEGNMIRLPASHWNADEDVAYARFASGKSDGSWLFIAREAFATFLKTVPSFDEVEKFGPPPMRSYALAKWADADRFAASRFGMTDRAGPEGEAMVEENESGATRDPRPARPDEVKCNELAALFDEEGVAKRDVKAPMIASRWNLSNGPVPKKEDITSRMQGQPKGRRSEG